MEINRLIEIAQNLGFEDLQKDLQSLSYRMSQANCPIVLPLVGEWSAGKTTILNALLHDVRLETDNDECTSTIYEIHFGCGTSRVKVIKEDGTIEEIVDHKEIKNAELTDAKIVEVFDTSKKVPSSVIFVDTPGINTIYAKNNQTLIDFLPKADGVLLVLDINQGMPASTTNHEFIKTISLSKRPIYVVFNKCDKNSKTPTEIKTQVDYLKENPSIKMEDIICVSAKDGDLKELYRLVNDIQSNKDRILQLVNHQRIKRVADLMAKRIDELIKVTHSDEELENAIRSKRQDLEKLNSYIDDLVLSLQKEIKQVENDVVRRFDEVVCEKLYSIADNTRIDFDSAALLAINNTMSLMLSEYKDAVKDTLFRIAREHKNENDAISLRSLEGIDVSSLSIHGPEYNLCLNELGHEYDGYIATATKVALVVAIAAGGAALAGGEAAATATTATANAAENAVTQVAASKVENRIARPPKKYVSDTFFDNLDTATDIVFDGGQMFGKKDGDAISSSENRSPGLIDLGVKLATDQFIGKPQRRRAIQDYVDSVLTPNCKSEIKSLTRYLISSIDEALHEEASQVIGEMTEYLENMRVQLKEQRASYEKRIKELKEFKKEIKEN